MDRRRLRWVLIGVSVASLAMTFIGLYLHLPFLAFFLFLPGLIGFGGFGRGRPEGDGYGRVPDDRAYCPECGAAVDRTDSFCRVCGKML